MQFAQLYQETVRRLDEAGISDARVDAVLLLEFCFGLNRSRLLLDGAKEVPAPELARFQQLLKQRIARKPLQYITGMREFWSLDFIVSPAVLVPRPETEFVLDAVLAAVKKEGYRKGPVLDMCTGSGVIAVVLARELKAEQVIAVDNSIDALQVACRNISRFGMENTIFPVCSDLFQALQEKERFEVVIANPPYIADGDLAGLEPEVRDFEPRQALSGGEEGLDVIAKLADEASHYLTPGGWLFVEIGADQGEKVKKLFGDRRKKEYAHVVVMPDWSGRPRLLQARKQRE